MNSLRGPFPRSVTARILPFGAALLMFAACGGGSDATPRMLGEDNLLVVADDALWVEIRDSLTTALKPQLPGLLPENTYTVSHAPPAEVAEADLRRFLQVVVLGRPDEALPAEVLSALPGGSGQPPALQQRAEVWAEGQQVTLVTIPDEGEVEAALRFVDAIADLVDSHYREWTSLRMYATGVNSDIAGALASAGIQLQVPSAYRSVLSEDSVHRFMTFGNDQSRLIRSVLLTWRPLDDTAPTVESMLEWRQSVVDRFQDEAQTTPLDFIRSQELDGERGGFEISGAWNGVMDGQPHAGPFVSRAIDCPEQGRRYLLDAWLFAPSRDKYTYLVQLEEVLNTFECAGR